MLNRKCFFFQLLITFLIFNAPGNSFSKEAIQAVSVKLCKLENKGKLSDVAKKNAIELQNCIDLAKEGDIVELLPGEYPIQKVIIIKSAIHLRTRGLAPDFKCFEDKSNLCAHLKAISPMENIERGFIQIQSPRVTFSQIVVDGNRVGRTGSPESKTCESGANSMGMNIHLNAPFFKFLGSSTMNALCGTGLEATAASLNLVIENSFAGFNGVHDKHGLWADGITVHQSENAIIKNNQLIDNTDIDLIFGGCKNCIISNNEIRHTDSFAQSAFAALMIQAWPNNGTNGDYTGSEINNNTIDCGAKRCGIGLLIGASPWYKAPTFGGSYSGNVVRGAQGGIIVNDATGDINFGVNTVTDSGGPSKTSGGTKTLPAFGRSSASKNKIKYLEGSSAPPWKTIDLSGSIPNWWQQK